MTKRCLYIRGMADKGGEVIAELEKRGGKNVCRLKGEKEDCLYYLNPGTGYVGFTRGGSETSKILLANGEELFLSTAEAKFSPGDRVRYQGKKYTVNKILEYGGKICYSLKGGAGILSPEHLELIEDGDGHVVEVNNVLTASAKRMEAVVKGNEERMKKILQSAAAMGQISDLIDEYGGRGSVQGATFIVIPFHKGGKIAFTVAWDLYLGGMLRFQEKTDAMRFIENHGDIIRDYLMCGG